MVSGPTVLALALQLAGSAAISDAPVKTARAAQERFELTRRAHLPWLRSQAGRACDAIVGRYCYWYDSTETKRLPEPALVVNARKALIALLDSLSNLDPANEWIVGQRVRYTIEGGDGAAALQAARSCRATRWWCSALEGLTHHVAGRYPEADAAFQDALADMPATRRCAWMDVRGEVAPTMAREFRSGGCEARSRKSEQLWRISQPLWGSAGNDLKTEHFARHTMAVLLDRSANGHGMRWSSDSRELLLRYGWAEWFSRAEPSVYQTGPGGVTGHDREPSYFFFPVTRSMRAIVTDSSWAFRNSAMPSRYAPRHIEWMGDLSHQLVRLPRGDSTRVLAVVRVRDSALVADSIELTIGALKDTLLRVARSAGRVASIDIAAESALISVEVYGARTHRAERARYTVAPLACTIRCLSDLLLFAADSDSATTLETATATAIAGSLVEASRPLGVYWELRAAGSQETPAWASIVVEPVRIGAARQAAARLHLADTPSALKLRWQLAPTPAGSVVLRLPQNARGRYRVKLSIDGIGSSERVVNIQ